MAIRWKEEMLQFETLREAEVWADSITNEIHGGQSPVIAPLTLKLRRFLLFI